MHYYARKNNTRISKKIKNENILFECSYVWVRLYTKRQFIEMIFWAFWFYMTLDKNTSLLIIKVSYLFNKSSILIKKIYLFLFAAKMTVLKLTVLLLMASIVPIVAQPGTRFTFSDLKKLFQGFSRANQRSISLISRIQLNKKEDSTNIIRTNLNRLDKKKELNLVDIANRQRFNRSPWK